MTDAAADRPAPVRSLRPLALLVTVQLLCGAVAGLVWWAWSPQSVSYLIGGQPPFVVPDESESQVAGDGRFVLMSIGLGMVFGLVAWRLRALRGPVVLATLAVAGLLSSLLARTVGELLPSGTPARQVDAAFHPQLTLHSPAALAVQAFFGVLVYTALAGLSADGELADSAHQIDLRSVWRRPADSEAAPGVPQAGPAAPDGA
ncbi:MAG: hypothetical protein JO144_13860 [Actinobacteria bacterium]|nr:hypothetical protein [Actinomycetota bacterium]